MFPTVTIILMDGSREGRKYIYESWTHVVVGRADDCDIHLYSEATRTEVSRHHCEFTIEPPAVRVRDLGSLNGTFVNGELIGRRDRHLTPADGDGQASDERELKDGDEVRMGRVAFRVGILAARDAMAPMYYSK